MSDSLSSLADALGIPVLENSYGMGHKTLREHNAVCQPGQRVTLDQDGDELCTGDPIAPSPTLLLDQAPAFIFRGGPSHRIRPRGVHGYGMGAPAASDIENFRNTTRASRASAAAGDATTARGLYAVAADLFEQMGSPPAYHDDLDYAHAAAFGEGTALADVRQQRDQLAAIDRAPISPSFGEVADELGVPGALFYGNFAAEQALHDEFGTPKPLARGTELTAAEMRALGLPGATPQSGRDLTTKPPVPIPGKVSGTAVGALVGGILGATVSGVATKGQATVAGGIFGTLLGGIVGYLAGDDSKKGPK